MYISSMSTTVRSEVTGFENPAQMYTQDRLDIHDLVVDDDLSTYYFRASRDWPDFNIQKGCVLVVDRSKKPDQNTLSICVKDSAFIVHQGLHNQHWGVITWILKPTL